MILLFVSIVIVLLLTSAFFSSCETAMTAVSKAKIHTLAQEENNKKAIILQKLLGELGLVVSVLLTCNTIINSLAVSLATGILINIFGSEGIAYASLMMGGLLLLYGEVIPKMVAIYAPEKLLLFAARPLNIVVTLFRPFNKLITGFAKMTLKPFGIKVSLKDNYYASLDELKGVIDLHKGPGQDVVHERKMLKSILDLGSVPVVDVMIHRKNVMMIDADTPFQKIVDQVLKSPFTRLPIWKNDPDNIVGVIHSKDLFRYIKRNIKEEERNVLEIAQPPWFIPESTDLLDQLQAFRARREHFAVVVDEYGAFLGIATLEDILEEIVGDIRDEHDVSVRGIRPQQNDSFIVDGTVTIRDLNRHNDWDLNDEDASTIAGLILHKVRMIPNVGQTFLIDGFSVEVLKKQRNQITLVRIKQI